MSAIISTIDAPASEKQIAFLTRLIEERMGRLDEKKQNVLDTFCVLIADGEINKRQASATIDMLLSAEWKPARKAAPAAAQAEAPEASAIPEGTYTVVLDSDDYVTIRVQTEAWCEGKVVASFLCGSDNESSYKGFGFVNGGRINVWSKFRSAQRIVTAAQLLIEGDVDAAHEEFLDRAEAYAMASGRCMRCHRKLTVPSSLHRGLGPDCAGREGV